MSIAGFKSANITDDGVIALTNSLNALSSLNYILAIGSQCKEEGIIALAEQLNQTNCFAFELTGYGNSLTVNSMQKLSSMLLSTKIAIFWLIDYQLNNQTTILLSNGIKSSLVTELAFEQTTFNDSMALLAPGITQLEILQFYSCHLTDNDLIVLASYLPGSAVQELYLGNNGIGDEGILALARILNFTNITLLSLFNNNITNKGAEALANIYSSTHLQELYLSGNNISSKLLAQIESFQWQRYCQDQLCHANTQYNGYTATLISDDPSPMRRQLSYRRGNLLKPSRRYDVFDSDVKRESSKKITWGAGSSIEVIEDDPLAAKINPALDHFAGFHTTESLPTWTSPVLSSPSSSESSAESLLTPATAGAMIVGTVGLSLLLYKNVTIVRAVVDTGCQLLQRCFCKASNNPKISTNNYSFHSQNKTRKAQCTESHPATAFNH